ncbi:MAG: T9SS type A sorting domain-containing protein [Candidatus Eisenbacteria bacterium]|nr:T9SS type A sorting domain-containing protein [Candidatus Latescibacterota bacterium]MBD3300849.1 T9SS type A sorting domain-containing protein [Candidatus Eisenbacteria bacterium]
MRGSRAAACAFLLVLSMGAMESAESQILEAFDDRYGIPFGEPLIVEPHGVLDNDLLDGENAGESGATASLVSDVQHGTLALNEDGSFTYEIAGDFPGTDQFVYRAEYGSVSDEATVILSACEGGPDVFTCWNENAFTLEVQGLGYTTLHEGFEDDAVWGHVRTPDSAPGVVSQGIEWRSNHPDPPPSNPISTTSGPPHSGVWAVFDPEHGYATGTPTECDVDDPPEHCLYQDGFSGTLESLNGRLHAVGGYLSGTYGANVGISTDGAGPIGGGKLTGGHQFFGVIDARPAGFSSFSFREMDGKVGQALYIFGDDFTIAGELPSAVEPTPSPSSRFRVTPNPATRSTVIEFTLRDPSRTRVEVHDLQGRLVRAIVDEMRPAGRHAIVWDRRGASGIPVADGLYFVRLTVSGSSEAESTTRKLVVID